MASSEDRGGWRCLIIVEILHQIAIELESHGYNSRRVALLALGLSCKTLLDLCLDLLWFEERDLERLIKTLPPGIWEESPQVPVYDQSTLIGKT
jgi:hypothetical protein